MSMGHQLEDADRSATPSDQRTTVQGWYAVATVLFFAVPFVGTDRLGLQPDLFYVGYFTIALAFLAAFLARYASELSLTGNPLGAVAAHTTMHVTAVVHQRDGGAQHMLPPRVDAAYPDHGSDDLAAGLAICWMVAGAAALGAVAVRLRSTVRG